MEIKESIKIIYDRLSSFTEKDFYYYKCCIDYAFDLESTQTGYIISCTGGDTLPVQTCGHKFKDGKACPLFARDRYRSKCTCYKMFSTSKIKPQNGSFFVLGERELLLKVIVRKFPLLLLKDRKD